MVGTLISMVEGDGKNGKIRDGSEGYSDSGQTLDHSDFDIVEDDGRIPPVDLNTTDSSDMIITREDQ